MHLSEIVLQGFCVSANDSYSSSKSKMERPFHVPALHTRSHYPRFLFVLSISPFHVLHILTLTPFSRLTVRIVKLSDPLNAFMLLVAAIQRLAQFTDIIRSK